MDIIDPTLLDGELKMAELNVSDDLQVDSPIVIRAITFEIRSEGSYKVFVYAEKPELEEDNEGYYNTLIF